MRVAMAQVSCELGAIDANLDKAERIIREAAADDADVVVFPELSINGYSLATVEDSSLSATDPRLLALSQWGPDVVIGFHEDARLRRFNSTAYLSGGELVHVHRKLYLPNYLSWEERKHSSPGQSMRAFDTKFVRMAALICNDAWQPMLPWLAAQDGAEVMLVPTNSAEGVAPGSLDTVQYWADLLLSIARMQQCWVVFVNRVGDEPAGRFWGGSRVLDPWGRVVAQAPLWEASLTMVDLDLDQVRRRRRELPLLQEARMGLVAREVARLIADGADA